MKEFHPVLTRLYRVKTDINWVNSFTQNLGEDPKSGLIEFKIWVNLIHFLGDYLGEIHPFWGPQ
jgi:hypothetical protein